MRRGLGFETDQSLKWGCVLLSCNSWRQAQVCMALARASGDAALKQYYAELALKFVQNVGSEPDPKIAVRSAFVIPTAKIIPVGLGGPIWHCFPHSHSSIGARLWLGFAFAQPIE